MRRSSPPFLSHRLQVFVPAVMSVGMLFWVFTLARDLFHWRSQRALERRGRIAGHAVATFTSQGSHGPAVLLPGLRVRGSYLLVAVILLGLSLYVLVGSTLNYVRVGGYVADIAWLLTISLIAAALFGFIGGIAATIWARWPDPPPALGAIVIGSPLSRLPGRAGEGRPRWELTAAALLTPFAALVLSLLVATSRSAVERIDRPVALWLREATALDALRFLDPLGSSVVAVALAAFVGLATLRCRLLFVTYPAAVVAGMVASVVVREAIERPRPPSPAAEVIGYSFPSGHVIQSMVIAGLFPLAVAVVTSQRRLVVPLRAVLFAGTAAGAVHRVHEGFHWPSDVLAGGLIGLGLVLAVDWVLANQGWHRSCRSCVWDPDTSGEPLLGAIHFHPSRVQLLRWAAHLGAAAGVIGLTVLTLTRSVPSNPEGSLLGAEIQVPVQLALAGLVSLGALVSWRWDAAGAVLIALGATGLGVFAALEYEPLLAITLTAALMVPAVLLWLSWQHSRSWAEIVALAVVTSGLLGGTWTGANAVYDHYFGPTHPASTVSELGVDRVTWAWAGNLSSEGVTVVARLDEPAPTLLRLEAGDGAVVETSPVRPSDDGIVRLTATGLQPGTEYAWQVVAGGQADGTRGRGRLRTPDDGPMSFTVAVASCARVGSNGAVYDAIAASDPLLYLALGDLHYSNLAATDPAAFVDALDLMLTRPAPANLYRQVPVAYVWDDHDYGPNDADSTSPSREAARAAYRHAVPHYPLVEDGPIYQAFTIGRVRFVMTDSRSERTATSMLGAEQVDWLIDELVASSRTHGLVVWANPVPWIGSTTDAWGGYPGERGRIADAIAEAGVDNLVMVSGDAHMVALDDGSNSGYATDGSPGFPVLHAAALDRPGSVKGGPYSHGAFPGGGHYGTLDVVDTGTSIEVTMSGWSWDGQRLVSETFSL